MNDKRQVGRTILGGVWMCDGPQEYKWKFTLHLPDAFDPNVADWAALLPADDVTGWLRMDKWSREIAIDPAQSRPDLETE